jgi:hypothetical protein
MVNLQSIVDAVKKKDPAEVQRALQGIAKDRKEQAAMDAALRTCSSRVDNGQIPETSYWACVPEEFQNELSKPSRIATQYTPNRVGQT